MTARESEYVQISTLERVTAQGFTSCLLHFEKYELKACGSGPCSGCSCPARRLQRPLQVFEWHWRLMLQNLLRISQQRMRHRGGSSEGVPRIVVRAISWVCLLLVHADSLKHLVSTLHNCGSSPAQRARHSPPGQSSNTAFIAQHTASTTCWPA